jgi:hypothetical protein
LAQSLIERRERGVEAGSGHRGQVEHGADRGAAPADATDASHRAAVAGEGSDADERRDLAPSQVTEFGQVDQQRSRDAGPDPGDGLEELEKLRTFGLLPQRGIDLSFQITDELRERSQHGVDRAAHGPRGRVAAVLLGHDQGDELTATGHEIGQQTR